MTLVVEEAAVVADAGIERPDQRELFENTDPPEGQRVELIGGLIVMSPTPVGAHSGLLEDLYESFIRENRPEKTRVSFSPVTIQLPTAPNKDCYVPDLCVLDKAAVDTHTDWKFGPDVVHLVVEVVSENSQKNDREVKPLGYASGHIPLYLLIDPLRSEVTLFADPVNCRYRSQTRVGYGTKISFPPPWNADLDTSIFIW
ncbi:Uma2 family endonuclease [Yinghuangia sp. ASG 101]|uniref:Uma2 family endonuclease n=1 Tax=Yinghuangia sp. ASG 101 TaxID=2896848 RepID=UPI001E3BB9F5|nr:Uma2 family endonuclease [Yinghuangia sp. ASG 101]UGQ09268.1 Uma2 family endonuclease [Yinghuangia sp. ASG 101]